MGNKKWSRLFETDELYDKMGNRKTLPKGEKVFINDLYQVNYRVLENMEIKVVHLSIKHRDKSPIHDWRHFQLIKNQLCGKDCCGIEFYPPESKLVDTANQYHLWVFETGDYFLFMFQQRVVSEDETLGNVQRKFGEECRPDDLMTLDDVLKMVMKQADEEMEGKNEK